MRLKHRYDQKRNDVDDLDQRVDCRARSVLVGVADGVTGYRCLVGIGTLATMMVFRGIAMVSTGGRPVSSLPKMPFFTIFGEGMILDIIPVPILWLLAMCVFLFFILHKTSFGVKVFATGDNREAAELAGIDTITAKKQRENLMQYKEQALLSRQLVTIDREAPSSNRSHSDAPRPSTDQP